MDCMQPEWKKIQRYSFLWYVVNMLNLSLGYLESRVLNCAHFPVNKGMFLFSSYVKLRNPCKFTRKNNITEPVYFSRCGREIHILLIAWMPRFIVWCGLMCLRSRDLCSEGQFAVVKDLLCTTEGNQIGFNTKCTASWLIISLPIEISCWSWFGNK